MQLESKFPTQTTIQLLPPKNGIALSSDKDITITANGKLSLSGSKGIEADGGSKMTIKAGAIEMN